MLLRSITKHVRDQNWFAVALDFFIVIAGILIAFQISNWNTERQEHASQKLIHQRLVEDFEIIEKQNDRAVAYIENLIDTLNTLHNAVTRGHATGDEDEDIKYALEYWFSYPSFNQRSGTYIELLSSGRLDLIENESLQIALSQYDRAVLQSKFNETNIHDIQAQNIGLVDFTQYRTMGLSYRDANGDFVRGPVTGYDIGKMAADPQFQRSLFAVIEIRTWLAGNIYGQRNRLRTVRDVLEETK